MSFPMLAKTIDEVSVTMATIDSTIDGRQTQATTSAGMPSIPSRHEGLDATSTFGNQAQKLRASAGDKVRGIADEGKAQVTQTLDVIVETARDIAAKLEATGAGPIARYAHQAADYVAGWSSAVDQKSLEEFVDDTRVLVRTSPAIAVGLSIAAGFALSRFLKATSNGRGF